MVFVMNKIKKIISLILISVLAISAPVSTVFASTKEASEEYKNLDKDDILKLFILSWYFDYESFCYLMDYISDGAQAKEGISGKKPVWSGPRE
jgi:hypothetical protein